eukprot:1131228-Pleurochrysis_carterae.AAC.1
MSLGAIVQTSATTLSTSDMPHSSASGSNATVVPKAAMAAAVARTATAATTLDGALGTAIWMPLDSGTATTAASLAAAATAAAAALLRNRIA